jgi:hypothetical protein
LFVRFLSLSLLTFILTARAALAHGPQIQITGETGQIVTRTLLPDGPYSDALSAEKSVYVIPIKQNLGAWYSRPNGAINPATMLPEFYSGPGIAYGYGYDPASPTDVDFTPGSVISLGFTDGLKLWNGAAFGDVGVTELEAFRGNFPAPTATARTSDAGPFASIDHAAVDFVADGAEAHSTMRFRLLGDGVSPLASSPDGVYLVGLQLSSTQAGMAPSDPFYFVLHKNADRTTVESAVASLNVDPALVQFVPEPASVGLAAFGLAGALAAIRLRRRS